MRVKDVFSTVIGIAGLAFSLGVIIFLMAMASSLIAHGWPKFLEGSSIADWLTAIGTICAAFFAVLIAASGRYLYKRDEKVKAERYVASARVKLSQVYESLKAIESGRFDRSYQVQDLSYGENIAIQQISRFLEVLSNIDVMMLAIVSTELSMKVVSIQNTLIKAAVEIKQLDADINIYKESIKSATVELKDALDLIDQPRN